MVSSKFLNLYLLIIIIIISSCRYQKYTGNYDEKHYDLIVNMKIKGNEYKTKYKDNGEKYDDYGHISYKNDSIFFESQSELITKLIDVEEKTDTNTRDSIKLIFYVTEPENIVVFYFYIDNNYKEPLSVFGDNDLGINPNFIDTNVFILFLKQNKLKNIECHSNFAKISYTPKNSNSNVFEIKYDAANELKGLSYCKKGIKTDSVFVLDFYCIDDHLGMVQMRKKIIISFRNLKPLLDIYLYRIKDFFY